MPRKLKRRPKTKMCTGCGRELDYELDFHHRAHTTADGVVLTFPIGKCRRCTAERTAAYRAKLQREGELALARARWRAGQDQENVRAYQRDWSRMNGILEGRVKNPRGPIRKYRRQERVTVDAQPFLTWFGAFVASSHKTENNLCKQAGVDPILLRRARKRGVIALEAVDAIVTTAGHPHLVAVLYPLGPRRRRSN